jgi:dTDP-glucose pyrophosphorylase
MTRIGVARSASLLDAIKSMDRLDRKLLLVTDDGRYVGLVTIGDIQRAIIKGLPMDALVGDAMRENITSCSPVDSLKTIREMMVSARMELMPVVSGAGELVDVILWEDVIETKRGEFEGRLDLPVVVMAGGVGSRMKPITNVIPKPLIPLGDKPIIEVIVDNFRRMGSREFYFSVNYKAEMIRQYFDELDDKDYTVDYLQEDKPLGTAGSLHLLHGKIDRTFFVSNCDIVVQQDLEEVYRFHSSSRNRITLVAALKHHEIPYGTVEVGEGGLLATLKEKPQMTYLVNTGLYVLEPEVIADIPRDRVFHIPALVSAVQASGGRVGVFPVSDGSWIDIGEWREYLQAQARLDAAKDASGL